MTSPTKIRIGFVGVGKMGKYHLEKFRQLPDVEAVGFFEANPDRAMEIERQFALPAFQSLAELFFEVDAAVVASPTDTHASIAHQALMSGVHLLIEKPITSRLDDAEALVRLAREKNLLVQVGMVERFRLAALAENTVLKPTRFLETHRLTPHLARESTIDVVADLMIHDLDLALSLVDEDPISVSAIGMRVVTNQYDLANVRLEFASGAVMNLNASRVSASIVRKMRVFTDTAYASFDFQSNSGTVLQKRSAQEIDKKTTQAPAGFDALSAQARDFVDCVRAGRRPLVSGEDGLRALKYAQIVTAKIQQRETAPANLNSFAEV